MIIGVSGKIGSGKDTVGNVIQYLTTINNDRSAGDNWSFDNFVNTSSWQIKKFAGKLKECISIITGIPIKDLEKEEVKNSNLPEEWNIYKYKASNGEYFAFGTKGEYNTDYDIQAISIRTLLQKFGTEVGRQIHSDFWVNALFADYKLIDHRTMQDPDDSNITYPSWIITDLRFPNELKAIEDRGGITIRVNRFDDSDMQANNRNQHPSETALDNATFDYTIENNGTIADLIVKMREIMINEKLL